MARVAGNCGTGTFLVPYQASLSTFADQPGLQVDYVRHAGRDEAAYSAGDVRHIAEQHLSQRARRVSRRHDSGCHPAIKCPVIGRR